MSSLKIVVYVALALAAVPAGQWLGSYYENKRVETLFRSLNEMEAEQREEMDALLAAQKRDRDHNNLMNELKVQYIIQQMEPLRAAYEAELQMNNP